jgi:glycosyltransferase involved in cell wall biosynthesis
VSQADIAVQVNAGIVRPSVAHEAGHPEDIGLPDGRPVPFPDACNAAHALLPCVVGAFKVLRGHSPPQSSLKGGSQLLCAMWKGKTVSVVFPTYNEKDYIRQAIEDFHGTGYVDEIVVVNNNAVAGTDDEVRKARARNVRIVYERARQGMGWSTLRGLKAATGDLVITAEPDGTFIGRDIEKLLVFSDDFDVVLGTRTTRTLIWEGANMGVFLKWGNWFIAKLIEVLFATPHLSDVGCTLRLYGRKALRRILPRLGGTGMYNYLNVHILLLLALNRIRFTEISTNFKKREGGIGFTTNKLRAFWLGLVMIGYLLGVRLLSWFGLYA